MTDLFLKLVNMSVSAGWIVLAVLLIRLLFKKAPKWINILLWGLVALRLCLPFSIKSILSLIPSTNTIPAEITQSATPYIESGFDTVNNAVNPILSQGVAETTTQSVNPIGITVLVASVVWLLGVVVMLAYTFMSYWLILRRVKGEKIQDKNIIKSDKIETPFIMGIIKPKIYIPSFLSDADLEYVLVHERAHIERRDYLWKPLGFAFLTVYWFNPLMWIAYIILCRDIEFACDEKVINKYGEDYKVPYSKVLIECSIPRKAITACPVAFGEIGIKARIKNILNYKKPSLWIMITAIVLSVCLAVGFLTDPVDKAKKNKVTEKIASEEDTASEPVELVVSEPSESNPADPSSEQELTNPNDIKAEIKNLYLSEMKDKTVKPEDINIYDYKAYSDGSVGVELTCIKHPNFGDDIDTVVAGYKYKYNIGYCEYKIYKDGKLYSFENAYSKGVISKKTVDEFFKSKQVFNKSVQLNGLSETIARKIINDYIGDYKQEFCEVILKYKCTLSDSSIAIWIGKTGVNYPAVMKQDLIADKYLYEYSSGHDWTIYKNGQFKSIKKAYESGLISIEVVDELFKKYPNLNSYNRKPVDDLETRRKELFDKLSPKQSVKVRNQVVDWLLSNSEPSKKKLYTDAEIAKKIAECDDYDIEPDLIFVGLTEKASKELFFKEFTPADFPGIDCKSVVSSSSESERIAVLTGESYFGGEYILDEFKGNGRHLLIYVNEQTNKNIIENMIKLQKMEIVEYVGLNYHMYVD